MKDDVVKKAKIEFGKIDGSGNGRRDNRLVLDLELRKTDNHPCLEFSVCGSVYNHIGTDIIWGGQMVGDKEILKAIKGLPYENRKLYQSVKELWAKWHLNCMKAGNIEQRAVIQQLKEEGFDTSANNYTNLCKELERRGVYEVQLTDDEKRLNPSIAERLAEKNEPYKYGCGWLAVEIPKDDMARIECIIDTYNNTKDIVATYEALEHLNENIHIQTAMKTAVNDEQHIEDNLENREKDEDDMER